MCIAVSETSEHKSFNFRLYRIESKKKNEISLPSYFYTNTLSCIKDMSNLALLQSSTIMDQREGCITTVYDGLNSEYPMSF